MDLYFLVDLQHASSSGALDQQQKLAFGMGLGAICLKYMIKTPFIFISRQIIRLNSSI